MCHFFKDVFKTLEGKLLNNKGDIRLVQNVSKKFCVQSIPTGRGGGGEESRSIELRVVFNKQ